MATRRLKGPSSSSEGDKLKISADITYYTNRPIKATIPGRNNVGATIYEGLFNGTIPIALKKYQTSNQKIASINDLKVLCSKESNHPNIIRYFGHAQEDIYTYIALELCECSVDDIVDPAKRATAIGKKPDMMKSILNNLLPKEILKESTEAVSYLHDSLKTIHRNLHPDNFLVACVDPNKDHFLIKLTDFQYSKDWIQNKTLSGTSGSSGWIAPEIPDDQNIGSNWTPGPEIDVFIMGCYYYYVLSEGKHPFGEAVDRRGNIKNKSHWFYHRPSWVGNTTGPIPNQPYFSSLLESDYNLALDLIKTMVVWEPLGRLPLREVSQHQFWKPEQAYKIYDNNEPKNKIIKPGICIIISQGKYHNPMMDCGYTCLIPDHATGGTVEEMRGIQVDTQKLGKLFTSFGYDVRLFKNLRAQQIETALTPEFLKSKVTNDSLDQYASLVVCILGHGDKGVICGVDGANVSLTGIQYGAFNRARCPELAGKPKIFISVACRGENLQKTTGQPGVYQDLIIKTPMSISAEQQLEDKSLNDDFLTLSSTIEEFQTHYDRVNGSAFIKILCQSLEAEYNSVRKKSRDLVQLFHYDVVPKMSSWYEQWKATTQDGNQLVFKYKQTPESRSSLTKTIRFQNHPNSSSINDDDGVNLIYDGELHDPSFKIARQLWPLRSYYNQVIGEEYRNRLEYQILLKTIFAWAKNEPELCQRAIAWSIFNRSEINPGKWSGRSIDEVCKEFYFWDLKNDVIVEDVSHPFYGIESTNADLKRIDLWLPNVYNEWSEWDPSNESTHFSNEPEANFEITAKIGNFIFYKERDVTIANLADTDEGSSQHQSNKGTKRKRK